VWSTYETVASSSNVVIRPAEPRDDGILQTIDLATWSSSVSPARPPAATASFFGSTTDDEVLVADFEGAVVGYVKLGPWYGLEASAHVLELKGIAVEPDQQRQGIGRLLVNAAVAAAKERKVRRLTLRVLGSNAPARTLYERCGFTVEGILREQFWLGGQYVDDVLMALDLSEGL
jgi:ribosomal protein S18 acetylase RimI-like enzyme